MNSSLSDYTWLEKDNDEASKESLWEERMTKVPISHNKSRGIKLNQTHLIITSLCILKRFQT